MARKNFERAEFVLGLIFSVIGVADVVLIIAISKGDKLQTCHEAIQSFLLAAVVVYSSIMLVRWYRHHDEILESLNLSTDLMRHDKMASYFKEIIGACSAIRQKRWPGEFAELFLTARLQHLNEETSKLKSGQMMIDLDVAQSDSPKYFMVTRGRSFVTAYGNWEYWTKPEGHNQLQANRQAITAKFGPIIRVFILPNHKEIPSDDIVQKQIDAKINFMVIHENDVRRSEFIGDVGVFFDGDRDEVVFMSEWTYTDPGRGVATLYFEGERLVFGKQMYDYLTSRARPIKRLADWTEYKAAAGNVRAGGRQDAPVHPEL